MTVRDKIAAMLSQIDQGMADGLEAARAGFANDPDEFLESLRESIKRADAADFPPLVHLVDVGVFYILTQLFELASEHLDGKPRE